MPSETTQFKPGNPGGPGRPKGSREKRSIVVDAVKSVYDSEEAFWEAIAKQAHDGDGAAVALLAGRLVPTLRAVTASVKFELPDGDLYAKADAVLNAIGEGEIPPDLGSNLLSAINSTAKTLEIVELEKRIQALEDHRG